MGGKNAKEIKVEKPTETEIQNGGLHFMEFHFPSAAHGALWTLAIILGIVVLLYLGCRYYVKKKQRHRAMLPYYNRPLPPVPQEPVYYVPQPRAPPLALMSPEQVVYHHSSASPSAGGDYQEVSTVRKPIRKFRDEIEEGVVEPESEYVRRDHMKHVRH